MKFFDWVIYYYISFQPASLVIFAETVIDKNDFGLVCSFYIAAFSLAIYYIKLSKDIINSYE